MQSSIGLPRLASSSRCLHAAQFLLGEASSSSMTRARLFSTASVTPTVADSPKTHKHTLLSSKLKAATNIDKPKLSPDGKPVVLNYKSSGIPLTQPKRRKRVKMKKRKKDLTADEAVKETTRKLQLIEARVLAAASVLSRGTTKIKPKSISRKAKASPDNEQALYAEEDAFGGKSFKSEEGAFKSDESAFPTEDWAPEPWNAPASSKTIPPPHITPANTVNEGTIGPNVGLLTDVKPRSRHLPIATLEHGLDRVLFNPGVHWLRDPRSRVYNFTPWLEKIPKVNDFAFERLSSFVTSSRDEDLRALAKQENRKFAGSTSSMSGMLSHIYFLISDHKEVELETLSQHFAQESSKFTSAQRMPASVSLNFKDGVYAIDSYSGDYDDSDKNVLTWLGTLLENFLTKTPQQFKTFMREESEPIKPHEKPIREAYRFAKSDKFVMRSQLDCQDKRLPGTGVFDLKTRACISIRMDILNYEENSGYMIKSQHGLLESFEREYYDLIRAAFLKYSFQVRIGNMDGVMVAYHNTERIFGFQYISLDEMDERLYGPVPGIGNKVFSKCIGLLEAVLEEASKLFPEQSVLCFFETPMRSRGDAVLDIFVVPAEWTGEEDQKPVKQLSVRVNHELDGQPVRSSVALRSVAEEWNMKYSISEVVLPADIVRFNLKLLENRKTRTLALPSSIAIEDAQKYWEGLNFSNEIPLAEPKVFRPEAFTVASGMVAQYRDLSRRGREAYSALEQSEKGKPKIVLGHGVYNEEEGLFFKKTRGSSKSENVDEEGKTSQ